MSIKEIYDLFLSKLSEAERQNYFFKLKFDPKNSSHKEYVFIAPNAFLAKFITTKYVNKLENFIELHTNSRPKISINLVKSSQKIQTFTKATPVAKPQNLVLNPAFTFENFIVGECNSHTFSVIKAACEEPGGRYNPIFIYGTTGLGKTHLLQAYGHESMKNGKKVMYATAENFMRDYDNHRSNNSFEKLKQKYRSPDVLLIDDVQLLGSTDIIQDEFFHTFNAVREHNGQIILSSDVRPKLLKGIEERLRSRFENGIMTDITPPKLDTKIAIIKSKCEINDIVLNDDIIRFIASKMGENIREIEGIIVNLYAKTRLSYVPITMDLVAAEIKDYIQVKKETITIDDILECISGYYNLRITEICSNKKTKAVVLARRVAIYLAATCTSYSYTQLALYFKLKDHSSISKSKKELQKLLDEDKNLSTSLEEIKQKLTNKGF